MDDNQEKRNESANKVVMELEMILPLLMLELAHSPASLVVGFVNTMRLHFRPIEDTTTLSIRLQGGELCFTMKLPRGENE
jgi:hypothetical protein